MKNAGEIQIAARYVEAVFDIAKTQSAVAAVEQDLRKLALATKEDQSFAHFMASPLLSRPQQAQIVDALAGSFQAHALTKAFLLALASQRRLGLLMEIARQFVRKAQADRGELAAELVTAAPIGKGEAQTIADRLGKLTGKKIILENTDDPALLGGAVVKVGGKQLDSSVAGKLERLQQLLKAA